MTETDIINNNKISDIVEKHFNLTKESIEIFKNNLFNNNNERIIDPKLKEMLGDDLRISLDISEEIYSDIDYGWYLFKDNFNDMILNSGYEITYKTFRENKIIDGKGFQKLFKATKKFYKSDPDRMRIFVDKVSRWDHVADYNVALDNKFKKITEEIGKYKIPNKKMKMVVSMNFADWFLGATSESWSSCLDLESENEGAFWSGLPGIITDPNRIMFYITDGSKKTYQGIEVDHVITRTWGILTDDNSIFPVRSYPTGIMKTPILNNLFKNFKFREDVADKFEWNPEEKHDDWFSKYPIELLYNNEGETSYIYQDHSTFCELGDSTARIKRNESGMHTIIDNKVTTDSAYFYTAGLESLIERKEDLGGYISGLTGCESCGCVVTKDDEFVGMDGETLCLTCYEDKYTYCEKCGDLTDHAHYYRQEILCELCYANEVVMCYECEDILENDEDIYFTPSGETICEQHFYEKYGYCEDCSELFELTELNTTEGETLCNFCLEFKEEACG